MMDLNEETRSCHSTGDVRNVCERLEQEPASNIAPVEISDKTDSKTIAQDKKTFSSHRQQNSYFQKETASCEIVANIWHSFNAFQSAIVNTQEKDEFLNYTSVIKRSPTSCTSGSLLPDTSKPRIKVIAENNEEDVKDAGIISTPAFSTTESLTSGSTIIPKYENLPSFSNAGFHKREVHCDIFNEDDDWDIYQPGIVTAEPILTTKSSLESQFIFESLMLQNTKHLSKNNSKSSVDYDSGQRAPPYIARGTSYLPSSNSVSNGDTFPEWNEERMLEEVKEYFLNNPVRVTDNISDLESKKRIITTPYFSRDFAQTHGLPLPTITPIKKLNLLEDSFTVSRVFAAYEMISKLGISEEDFFSYISMDNHRPAYSSPRERYMYNGLDLSTIQHLDLIQEQVGPDIFPIIYEQLRTGDAEFLAIFRDPELLNETIQFWNAYEKMKKLLREQHANIGDNFLFQIQTDSTSDVISDVLVSQTNTDFPSPISRSHVIKTPGLNDSDSCADDREEKALHKILKTSQSSTGLSKVQSIKRNDISETELKSSPILESANQDNEDIRSSFDFVQGHSDKPNDSPDLASIMISPIQNSVDQNDKTKSNKTHSVKSRNSPNKATHSSDQNFKENSDDRSGKSYDALQNVSYVQYGVGKYISQNDDAKSRKKICLQENSNTGPPETKKKGKLNNTSNKRSLPS